MFDLDLAQLNDAQREAVLHGEGPLLILAGAGSGKTRVITYRVAYLLKCGVKPWNILAVTFTNKAAGEMKERIYELTRGQSAGAWVSTFHSFCAQFLRAEGPALGLDRNFAIYDEDDQKKVVRDCLKELNLDEKKMKISIILSRISREKDQLMDPESFAIAAAASIDPSREMLAAIYALYQRKLEKAAALDFGDLIMKTVEFLKNNDALRLKYQERFHYVLVDEYQDTNRAQYVLTKTLAAGHKNLCVVGDDDQSIYSWRGADIRNILDFEKDYEKVQVVKLEQNYRSTQPILSAAWNLVKNNRQRKDKTLWTEKKSETPVHFEQLGSEVEEADWIVRRILNLESAGYKPSQAAVFYRTNAQSRVLEDAFRKAQVPYVIVGSVRFYERAEVKDALAYLRLIVNPRDDVSFKRIVNFPHRGIGKTTLETIEKYALEKSLNLFEAVGRVELVEALPPRVQSALGQFRKMMADWIAQRETLPVSQMIKDVLVRTRILEMMQEEAKTDIEIAGRLDNVQELLNATEEFEEISQDKRAGTYLEQVSLSTSADHLNDKQNGVTLMTVHIAKGLEFPLVFVTGLEEGLFPLGEAQFDSDDLEEERRLAYVGMTRARERLYLTCAASRRLFGQTHWNMPSRFVQEAGVVQPSRVLPEPRPFVITESFAPRAPETREEPGPSASKNFRVGQRVRHAQFGSGRVTDRSGSGDDLKVIVSFDSGEWKKLLVKYAPLEGL